MKPMTFQQVSAAYARAALLRAEAERLCDPDLYERAAADFDGLGYKNAADQCRRRANHYRQVQRDSVDIRA